MKTNKKVVLLLAGKKGTGKSTLANALVKELSTELTEGGTVKKAHSTAIVSFAGPLKKVAQDLLDTINEQEGLALTMEDNKEVVRPLLQGFGQMMRAYQHDYWIKKAQDTIRNGDKDIYIIDDCRFPNEFKAFENGDFITIKIKLDRESIYPGIDNDISETALDHIPNDDYNVVVTDVWKEIEAISAKIKKSIK